MPKEGDSAFCHRKLTNTRIQSKESLMAPF
jgi:hypothetical protein